MHCLQLARLMPLLSLPQCRRSWLVTSAGLVLFNLSSCSPAAVTYAELQVTAATIGCWPGNAPTPPPVTVTPRTFEPDHMAKVAATQAQKLTSTALPTTTAYPRCTPMPGAPTLVPWPTPLPTPVPYPTQVAPLQLGGSDPVEIMHLPGTLVNLAEAVHPTEGWPAVAVEQVAWDGQWDHRRIWVRVYDPAAHQWSVTQQVNRAPADGGKGLQGGLAIAIGGDGTVHVAWGGSFQTSDDADDPVWYTASSDYGHAWTTPQQIGHGCFNVSSMAATLDGQVVVLAHCVRQPIDWNNIRFYPSLLTRQPGGTWSSQWNAPVDGATGSVVIVGDGLQSRVVALTHAKHTSSGWLITRRLATGAAWDVRQIDASPALGQAASSYYHSCQAITFTRPNGQSGILATCTSYGQSVIYAWVSLDGGTTWGPVEPVVGHAVDDSDPQILTQFTRYATPAYDPVADRLVVLWVQENLQTPALHSGTHYASWSVPGSGVWQPRAVPGNYAPRIPLVTGARNSRGTVGRQAAHSQRVWLAWLEGDNAVMARSLDLDLVVPRNQYPATTSRATTTPTQGALR